MASVRPEFLFVGGPQKGQRAVLMDNHIIGGRVPQAQIRLVEEFVSRQQFALTLSREGWIIENLSKSNPLAINGKKYKPGKKVILGTGDVIAVGAETEMLFVEADDDPAQALATYRAEHPEPEPTPVPVAAPQPVIPQPVSEPETPAPAPRNLLDDEPDEPATAPLPGSISGPATEELPPEGKPGLSKTKKYLILAGIWGAVLLAAVVLLSIYRTPETSTRLPGQPVRLTHEEIVRCMTADLERQSNETIASRHLDQARRYARDRASEREYAYLALKHYRLHKAFGRGPMATSDEAERMAIEEELLGRGEGTDEKEGVILRLYDNAILLESTRSWRDARNEWNLLLEYIPQDMVRDDEPVRDKLMKNIGQHINYCARRLVD